MSDDEGLESDTFYISSLRFSFIFWIVYCDLGRSLTALAKVMRLFASHSLCCVVRAERTLWKRKKEREELFWLTHNYDSYEYVFLEYRIN